MPQARLSLAVVLLLQAVCRPAQTQPTAIPLARGVVLQQETIQTLAGTVVANTLRVDLKDPTVHVRAALAQDVVLADDPTQGRETIGSLVARHHAVAGVNADYFPYTGDPLGLAVRDGELVSETMPFRAAIGIKHDGTVLIDTLLTVGSLTAPDGSTSPLDGINRPAGQNELILLTPTFGPRGHTVPAATTVLLSSLTGIVKIGSEVTAGADTPAPGDPDLLVPQGGGLLVASGSSAEWLKAHVHGGDRLRIRFDLARNPLPSGVKRGGLASRAGFSRRLLPAEEWNDVEEAVGGGPWLVRDGVAAVDGLEEGFDPASFVQARHPRTAVGVTAGGELLLVTVDGRQRHSRGMSLPELAAYMVHLGAVRAINLDGGGSTTMVARGLYVNAPSDGIPNAVADALLVYVDGDHGTAPQVEAAITASEKVLHVGETVKLTIPGGTGDGPVLWGTTGGTAFVSQQGLLTATRAGTGVAVAQFGAQSVRFPYTILGGVPAAIKAVLLNEENNPPDRNLLSLRVLDAHGSPVAGAQVRIQVHAGSAEQATATTDKRGEVTTEVIWDSETDRSVTISAGSLPPVAVKPTTPPR